MWLGSPALWARSAAAYNPSTVKSRWSL